VSELNLVTNMFREINDTASGVGNCRQYNREKFIGYMCSYVPVEIIMSAGYVPFRLSGSTRPITKAYAYLPSACCSVVSGALERALQGEFDFLSGLIIPQTCDRMREIFDVFRVTTNITFYHNLIVPMRTDIIPARQFYYDELKMFIAKLAEMSGKEIGTDQINMAIKNYNVLRGLLRKASDARISATLTGLEYHKVLMAAFTTPPEKVISAINNLLQSLSEKRPELEGRVRLLVSGSVIDNLEQIALLENYGALVVSDDLCYGLRGNVGLIPSDSKDPVSVLAQKYLGKINCPCKYPSQIRWQNILENAKASQVDGVVLMLKKFCDCHWIEQPELERRLKAAGYPVLVLGIDNETAIEALRTRMQAFLEMVTKRKSRGFSNDCPKNF